MSSYQHKVCVVQGTSWKCSRRALQWVHTWAKLEVLHWESLVYLQMASWMVFWLYWRRNFGRKFSKITRKHRWCHQDLSECWQCFIRCEIYWRMERTADEHWRPMWHIYRYKLKIWRSRITAERRSVEICRRDWIGQRWQSKRRKIFFMDFVSFVKRRKDSGLRIKPRVIWRTPTLNRKTESSAEKMQHSRWTFDKWVEKSYWERQALETRY